ncbi:MAG: glycosyltransferase family 4 protein [Clostridia bacterium]|nr:glycosyltransferase family 4 protein [Clostridia bacterium]
MKILFLEGDMSRRGGTERMTAWLSSKLSEKHTVSIISLYFKDSAVFFKPSDAVDHIVLKSSKALAQILEIRRYIIKNSVDLVINVDTGMGYIGILAASGTSAKVITWEHANFFNNWNSRIFPYLRQFAARKSDAMVVLTERDKRNYEEHIKNCTPVTVIPNPAKKMSYNYDTASKIILSAGLLGKIKRFDMIVPIGKAVFSKYSDWKWLICGDGPERENLEVAVKEAGLQNHIQFCGSVSDMDAQYAAAAMYVLTSEMEGLPMVLLEAKSHGLPIVSFDIETGPSDIVRDSVNGYLVESGDTDAMAERICQLIEDEALRLKFSENTALDMDKFEEERIVEVWEQLTRNL